MSDTHEDKRPLPAQSSTHTVANLTRGAYLDLKKSGITDDYIRMMRIRQTINLDDSKGTNADDYIIPYFKSSGEIYPAYYRERVFRLPNINNPKPPKYVQKNDGGPTRVYFPPNWQALRFESYLVITEGEKKCASVAQYGVPCIGLGGVDSWRTKKIEINPENITKLIDPEKKQITYSLDIDEALAEILYEGGIDNAQVAPELLETIQEAARLEKTVYICYDTDKLDNATTENGDPVFGTKLQVNQSAFALSMWLMDHGVTKVEFVQLPAVVPPNSKTNKPEKTGLDDFVISQGIDSLKALILGGRHTFPTLTNVRYFVNKTLNGARVKRKDYIKVARAIVADLDRHGQRYTSSADVHYYYEHATKSMMQLSLSSQEMKDIRLTDFGKLLFERYGLSSRDEAALKEIGDQFVNMIGIKQIEARRVSYASHEQQALYFQLDDGTMLKAGADGVTFHDNGFDDVLFVRNLVEPINLTRESLKEELSQEKKRTQVQLKEGDNRWLNVFKSMQIQPMEGFTMDETYMLLCAHFYLNPWFRRWNNLMLPMELTIAEPGSGKSLFYMLRKMIFTGRTTLNRLPQDVRDWYANITDSEGMFIADNVGKMNGALKQTYSDEFARLITEMRPAVTMRKLYTTASDVSFPIDCTFAITAINNPFTNEDIMQRSLMVRLKAIPKGERNSNWMQSQMNDTTGGRLGWILHHMLVSVRFLHFVKNEWNDNYQSKHRLMHYEQSLLIMGQALNFDKEAMKIVVSKLSRSIQSSIASNNPVIEGLLAYAQMMAKDPSKADKMFSAQDIVDWALMSEEFSDIQVLTNSRTLGRYISSHAYDIHESAGIHNVGKRDGKAAFKVDLDIVS